MKPTGAMKRHTLLRRVIVPQEKGCREKMQEEPAGGIEQCIKDPFTTPLQREVVSRILQNPAVSVSDRQQLAEYLMILQNMGEKDQLTGLYNGRRFYADLDIAIHREERHHEGLSLLLVDLDHLKKINDTFGRLEAGDAVLERLGEYLCQNLRQADDAAYRLHEDEFAVIATRAPLAIGKMIGERIRQDVERDAHTLYRGFTVSIGVASYSDCHKEELLGHVDYALGRAKETRNTVFAYRHSGIVGSLSKYAAVDTIAAK